MNLGDVIAAAERQTGRVVSFEWGRQLVNDALGRVSSKRDWPWLEYSDSVTGAATDTTLTFARIYAAGDGEVAAEPADRVLRIRQVSEVVDNGNGTADRELRCVSLREINDQTRIRYQGGETRLWAIDTAASGYRGVRIRVSPALDAATTFKVLYIRAEPELLAASETPLLPAQFHPYLVAYVVERVHRRHGETQRAVEAKVEAEQVVREMLDDQERVSGPFRVRVRPGGGI